MKKDYKNRRRQFIRQSLLFTALAGVGNLASSTPGRAQNGKLGVALVGLGRYSEYQLAPALQQTEYCELRGIVTGSPNKIPVWQQRYGIKDSNVYNYDNLHQIANNLEIDVVYVVVPTALHKHFTEIAANAGKHVWCEKPMAMTVTECESMINTCNKNKVRLSIGYRMQHEPNTQTIIEYAASKPYGSIVQLTAKAGYRGGVPAPGDWRLQRSMGGGAAYDMGVYPINAARYTTGQEPIAVTARHKSYRPEAFTQTDEATFFTLEFGNGILADCATSVFESMNHLRADCETGWYELKPFQSYSGVRGITSDGKRLNLPIANQQATQMDNDALSILFDKPMLVPGLEGLNDVRIVEAMLKSAATDGERIKISI